MSSTLKLTRNGLKAQAKALRLALAEQGQDITHSQSLELLAKQLGARDWNTLVAQAAPEPNRASYTLGQQITGQYLGQDFSGTLLGVQAMNAGERTRLVIEFDQPVNVAPEMSFEVMRRRVTAHVGADGRTLEKTSDGVPHMVLEPC